MSCKIKNYPNYTITNTGIITNKYNKEIGNITKKGYRSVKLYCNGKYKVFLIHRLVLEHFDKPCPDNLECDHKDRNKLNNCISNLHWVSSRENGLNRGKIRRLRFTNIKKHGNKYRYMFKNKYKSYNDWYDAFINQIIDNAILEV